MRIEVFDKTNRGQGNGQPLIIETPGEVEITTKGMTRKSVVINNNTPEGLAKSTGLVTITKTD